MDAPSAARSTTPDAPAPRAAASGASPAGKGPPQVPFKSLLAAARGRPSAHLAGARGGGPGGLLGAPSPKRALSLGAIKAHTNAGPAVSRKSHHGDDEDPTENGDESPEIHRAHRREEIDGLDPWARSAAQLAPPAIVTAQLQAASASATEPLRARSLEELLPVLVRRIAWAGDKHRGTVHLELGAGAYAGATVTVHAEGGRVRVEIGGSEGPDLDRLRTRLDARLRGHGLDVESVS